MEDLQYYIDDPFTFSGKQDLFSEAKVVFFGVPLDVTASFKKGTHQGPNAIREASKEIESYNQMTERDPVEETKIHDLGNLWITPGNLKETLDRIKGFTSKLLAKNKIPFMLGGEHTSSLPVIKALHEKHPDLVVVHFDAHADLKDEYKGDKTMHASFMRRVLEFLPKDQLMQIGVRSLDTEENEFIKSNDINTFFIDVAKQTDLDTLLDEVKRDVEGFTQNKPTYITFDIDCLDASIAPGTGTPEPNGLTYNQAAGLIKSIRGNVVGCDMMEVCRDKEMLTPTVATKLIFKMLELIK